MFQNALGTTIFIYMIYIKMMPAFSYFENFLTKFCGIRAVAPSCVAPSCVAPSCVAQAGVTGRIYAYSIGTPYPCTTTSSGFNSMKQNKQQNWCDCSSWFHDELTNPPHTKRTYTSECCACASYTVMSAVHRFSSFLQQRSTAKGN